MNFSWLYFFPITFRTRVIIEARDGSVDNPKTDETVFVITVDDINDNAPEITISYIVDAEDDISKSH